MDALIGAMDAAVWPVERQTMFCVLGLLARYPSTQELAEHAIAARVAGVRAAADRIMQSAEFRGLGRSRNVYDLHAPPDDTLLIDITHTIQYHANSGIQRVVRQLCRSLKAANRRFRFILFEPGINRPRFASDEESARLTEWERFLYSPRRNAPTARSQVARRASPLRGAARAAARFAKALFRSSYGGVRMFFTILLGESPAGERVARQLEAWELSVKLVLSLRRNPVALLMAKLRNTRSSVVLLWESSVLVPEIAFERERVDTYICAKRWLPFQLTLIVYDLIPVSHPEFVVQDVKLGFLKALTLLRVADRISCISNTAAAQVRSILGAVDRTDGTAPTVETHLLAGNFGLRSGDGAAAPADEVPMALCVGTIEPRKNGLGILRAAALLARDGIRFRLVFAGNEGWLADRFRSELRRCQAAGLDVDLLTSVSDEELAGLYSRCHCTVFCSFAEGFGLPILESLHFHRPVVVSDRGSMAEIAAHGGCVLVDPADVESVAGGLRRLLVDSAFHEELTRQARAIRWCTWAEYADRIYGFALGEKSTREIESARERGP